ncbi:hypothetical protein BDP27DRAFT_1427511 [Rhodocollybia butyracea]|uniref:Uncharacterized protein n=1 Tax=Rhodocollybia butyracea TaxID=206335 RepID=A0A9P5U2N3_9AGAR|nr:hypothetical protein BDP27DRAFT_1427511 [Rhodocollybia butyracea]
MEAEARGQSLSEAERAVLFGYFGSHPKSSVVAAHIYEPHVHETISDNEKPLLALQRMHYKTHNKIRVYATEDAPQGSYPKITPVTRTRVVYQTLPGMTDLDLDAYYIPARTNNPFFDSFFFSCAEKTIKLMVVQVSIRYRHEETTEEGYAAGRQIASVAGVKFQRKVTPRIYSPGTTHMENHSNGSPSRRRVFFGHSTAVRKGGTKEAVKAAGTEPEVLDYAEAAGETAKETVPLALAKMRGYELHCGTKRKDMADSPSTDQPSSSTQAKPSSSTQSQPPPRKKQKTTPHSSAVASSSAATPSVPDSSSSRRPNLRSSQKALTGPDASTS